MLIEGTGIHVLYDTADSTGGPEGDLAEGTPYIAIDKGCYAAYLILSPDEYAAIARWFVSGSGGLPGLIDEWRAADSAMPLMPEAEFDKVMDSITTFVTPEQNRDNGRRGNLDF
jgi:hypothetical protein